MQTWLQPDFKLLAQPASTTDRTSASAQVCGSTSALSTQPVRLKRVRSCCSSHTAAVAQLLTSWPSAAVTRITMSCTVPLPTHDAAGAEPPRCVRARAAVGPCTILGQADTAAEGKATRWSGSTPPTNNGTIPSVSRLPLVRSSSAHCHYTMLRRACSCKHREVVAPYLLVHTSKSETRISRLAEIDTQSFISVLLIKCAYLIFKTSMQCDCFCCRLWVALGN